MEPIKVNKEQESEFAELQEMENGARLAIDAAIKSASEVLGRISRRRMELWTEVATVHELDLQGAKYSYNYATGTICLRGKWSDETSGLKLEGGPGDPADLDRDLDD